MPPPYTRGASLSLTGTRAKAWCVLLIHAEASLSHGVRAKVWCLLIHAEASRSLTGARAKAWVLLIHAEASLTHGGQGESMVPPYTRGSVSLSRGPGRKPGASVHAGASPSLQLTCLLCLSCAGSAGVEEDSGRHRPHSEGDSGFSPENCPAAFTAVPCVVDADCSDSPRMAVQLDPMILTLYAPGTKRLKLNYRTLLSSFAFNFNLRLSILSCRAS